MTDSLTQGLADPNVEERELLRSSALRANACVADLGQGRSDAPAATLVAAIAKDNRLTVVWIGDSRAYWIAGGTASRITRDHASEDPENFHALTRWVGADASELEPEIVQQEIAGPGLLLLCSDGLWNYAAHEEDMATLVTDAAQPDPAALSMARKLVEFAIGQGGHDNITAAILQYPIQKEPFHAG